MLHCTVLQIFSKLFFISLDPAEIHQPGIPAWSGHLLHPHPQVSRVPYIAQKKYLSKNVVCESAYTILCTPNALRYVQYIEYCLTIVHN